MDDLAPRHPIRVVAQRTGLTTATIRAWERRYEAVAPGRSDGGQRLYSDRDVARLRTLKQLTDAGRSISMVAELGEDDAKALLAEDQTVAASATWSGDSELDASSWVDQTFALIRALDADNLERTLWRAMITLGAHAFLTDVAAPLLKRVGEAWVDGDMSPGQEHMGSEVLDRMLERLASRVAHSDGPRLVVSTLPGERHGLGARLAAVAAVLEGWRVVNLGTDLPVHDIATTARDLDAWAVAISVVRREDLPGVAHSLLELRSLLPSSIDVLVGGGAASLLPLTELPKGVHLLDGLSGLGEFLPTGRGRSGRVQGTL